MDWPIRIQRRFHQLALYGWVIRPPDSGWATISREIEPRPCAAPPAAETATSPRASKDRPESAGGPIEIILEPLFEVNITSLRKSPNLLRGVDDLPRYRSAFVGSRRQFSPDAPAIVERTC